MSAPELEPMEDPETVSISRSLSNASTRPNVGIPSDTSVSSRSVETSGSEDEDYELLPMPKERPPPEPGVKGWLSAFLRGSQKDYKVWKDSEREREQEHKESIRRKEQRKRDKEKAKRKAAKQAPETGESSKARDKGDDAHKHKHKHKHKKPHKSRKSAGKDAETTQPEDANNDESKRPDPLTDDQCLDGSSTGTGQTQGDAREGDTTTREGDTTTREGDITTTTGDRGYAVDFGKLAGALAQFLVVKEEKEKEGVGDGDGETKANDEDKKPPDKKDDEPPAAVEEKPPENKDDPSPENQDETAPGVKTPSDEESAVEEPKEEQAEKECVAKQTETGELEEEDLGPGPEFGSKSGSELGSESGYKAGSGSKAEESETVSVAKLLELLGLEAKGSQSAAVEVDKSKEPTYEEKLEMIERAVLLSQLVDDGDVKEAEEKPEGDEEKPEKRKK